MVERLVAAMALTRDEKHSAQMKSAESDNFDAFHCSYGLPYLCQSRLSREVWQRGLLLMALDADCARKFEQNECASGLPQEWSCEIFC